MGKYSVVPEAGTRAIEVGRGPLGALKPKLSRVLLEGESKRFDSMVSLPSNVQAIESALLFGTGRSSFVVLVGPSGWGKSHLVSAAAHTMATVDRDSRPQVVDGRDWLTASSRLDPFGAVLVDNAQETLAKGKSRVQFRLALERRLKAGRPTLLAITAPKPTRALRALLPNHNAWVVATIETPTVAERPRVVSQIAKAEGLAISDSLRTILARQLVGDGRTLEGAFKRLRLQDTRWLDAGSTLRALGILNPFFTDNSGWDLREAIWGAAERRCRTLWNRDLATYVMLHVALLAESDVAHFFEFEPCEAYGRALDFHRQIESNEDVRLVARRFIEEVVDDLARLS